MPRWFKNWYEGKLVPLNNDPGSALIFVNHDERKRSLSARALRVLVEFWLRHWQWCTVVAIAIAGLMIQTFRR
jgi:hypothetical protein